jgi:hypothetical protein
VNWPVSPQTSPEAVRGVAVRTKLATQQGELKGEAMEHREASRSCLLFAAGRVLAAKSGDVR